MFQARSMVEGDLKEVAAMESQLHISPWSLKQFEQSLLQPKRESWVICRGEELCGYLVISQVDEEVELLNLSVNRDWHRRGIGSQLMELMFAKIAPHTKTIFLEVRASNTAAIRLYDKFGFDQVGVRKNYYPALNGREDAIIMAKEIFPEEK